MPAGSYNYSSCGFCLFCGADDVSVHLQGPRPGASLLKIEARLRTLSRENIVVVSAVTAGLLLSPEVLLLKFQSRWNDTEVA